VAQAHVRGYLTRTRVARIKARKADPKWRRHARRQRSRSPSPHKKEKETKVHPINITVDTAGPSQVTPLLK
jgi:hypothetical protein